MQTRLVPIVRALLLLLLVAVAAGVPTSRAAQASNAQAPDAQAGALALVYLNEQNLAAPEVWVTSLDGATHRTVATLTLGTLPIDLRGSLLALSTIQDFVVLDLGTGAMQRVPLGPGLTRAHIGADGTVYYTFSRGNSRTEPSKTTLSRLDMATGAPTVIRESGDDDLTIVWDNPETNEILINPRNTGPYLGEFWLIDATTGEQKWSRKVVGCNSSLTSPDGHQVITTWTECDSRPNPISQEVNVYNLVSPDPKVLKFPRPAQGWHPFKYSPDGSHAAFGLSPERAGPSAPGTSQGIWLLDLSTFTSTKLWQDDGIDAWPIAWTPDGTRLLVASARDQNHCTYSILDVASGEGTPVNGFDQCGPLGGELVGFTTVPGV